MSEDVAIGYCLGCFGDQLHKLSITPMLHYVMTLSHTSLIQFRKHVNILTMADIKASVFADLRANEDVKNVHVTMIGQKGLARSNYCSW
jgi:hypothetical protein